MKSYLNQWLETPYNVYYCWKQSDDVLSLIHPTKKIDKKYSRYCIEGDVPDVKGLYKDELFTSIVENYNTKIKDIKTWKIVKDITKIKVASSEYQEGLDLLLDSDLETFSHNYRFIWLKPEQVQNILVTNRSQKMNKELYNSDELFIEIDGLPTTKRLLDVIVNKLFCGCLNDSTTKSQPNCYTIAYPFMENRPNYKYELIKYLSALSCVKQVRLVNWDELYLPIDSREQLLTVGDRIYFSCSGNDNVVEEGIIQKIADIPTFSTEYGRETVVKTINKEYTLKNTYKTLKA